MAIQLLTPFTMVARRSVTVAAGVQPISGTWVSFNAAGEAVLPAAAGQGNVELVLEGVRKPSEKATFNATNEPSELVTLPSAAASNTVATAYGVFRFEVGPEGFTPAVETATPGTLLYVTTTGKLDTTGGSGAVAVAVVEQASATKLVARTLANG